MTIAPANQLTLDLQLPEGRPMVPLEVVMVLADRHEDDCLSLIETGAIPWAWDIRHPDAERREIRVWRDSLLEYLQFPIDRNRVTGAPVRTLNGRCSDEEVLQALFPHHRAEIRSTELQRMFSCSQTHVSGLVECGEWRESDRLAVASRPGSGPNAFRRITRVSVIEFLQRRGVV